MRKHAITFGVIAGMFIVLMGTGLGQIFFAILVFAGHFVGYALWQTESPNWWPLLFFFAVLAIVFIGLRRWLMRKYLNL